MALHLAAVHESNEAASL